MRRKQRMAVAGALTVWAVASTWVAYSLYGRLARASADPASTATSTNAVRELTAIEQPAEFAAMTALRMRVAELQAQNRALRAQVQQTAPAGPAAPAAPATGLWWGAGYTDYMAELERSDPQLHAQTRQRLDQLHQRAEDRLVRQIQFLLGMDTAGMTPEEVAIHEELLRVIADTWTLAGAVRQDPSSPEARAAQARLREHARSLDELFAATRAIVLRQYGLALGYDDAQAARFADEIEQLIDLTTVGGSISAGAAATASP